MVVGIFPTHGHEHDVGGGSNKVEPPHAPEAALSSTVLTGSDSANVLLDLGASIFRGQHMQSDCRADAREDGSNGPSLGFCRRLLIRQAAQVVVSGLAAEKA